MSHYSPQFEQARQAVTTITTLRPQLSSTELESLAIMLDHDAMTTIEQSIDDAERGDFEPLEVAVNRN